MSVLSAGLLRLAFPKFDVWPLAWVGLVPLCMALEKQRLRHVVAVSWLCGFLFFVTTLYWLIHVTVSGLFVLAACLGLFFVFFGMAFRFAERCLSMFGRPFFLSGFWVLLEYLRAQSSMGFPWALLAYSQTGNIVAIQVADIGGAYMVSFYLVLVNAAVFELIRAVREKRPVGKKQIAVLLCFLAAWWGYGFFRVLEKPARKPLLNVSLVQGNIPQAVKWVPKFSDMIDKKYRILSELIRLKDEPDLLIWPETAVQDYLDIDAGDDARFASLARDIKTPLLFGSIRFSKERYYNSALFYDKEGRRAGLYDKMHLVPYGEYLPLRRALPALTHFVPIEDFTAGRKHAVFSVPGVAGDVPFGILICFEDIFPDLATKLVVNGARFLVNITNDAWFEDTASPYQHMQASVLRAVENRVPVVRAANTGITCVIDDMGRVISRVEDASRKPTYVTGFVTERLWSVGRRSFYSLGGDIFMMGCLGMVVVFLWAPLRRNAKGVKP